MGPGYNNIFFMVKWTQLSVERKLLQTTGFDSFLSLKRGYLPVRIGKTEIFIFREEIGISYYYRYPIFSVEEAQHVNDFMSFAFPILSEKLEQSEKEYLMTL